MICRYPGDTAPWDSATDRGSLADLTAFVLADRASFLCEGTSLQWVNRHRIVDAKPDEPAVQQVELQPFHQLAFRADCVERLQQ